MNEIKLQIDTDICFKLQSVSRKIARHYDSKLRKKGLRCHQFFLLVAFSNEELSKKPITEVASRLCMDRSTLSVNLSRLRERGYVQETSPLDQRIKLHTLTESGREALVSGSKIISDLKKEIGSAINVFENGHYDNFLDSLHLVCESF